MATAVVCDDDAVARSAITVACEEAGLEVVAETDRGADAAELIRRFDVDLLVIDPALSDGSGERTIENLQLDESTVCVVAFTVYSSEPWRLLRHGVREVITKPNYELLQSTLSKMGSSIDSTTPANDRRLASREVTQAPKMWRSPAGVSSHHDLAHAVLGMEVGDAVLAITIVGLDALEADVGRLLAADCCLAVAATLRDELRVQDLLHEAPEIGGFIALLRGGDARAAGAAWSRLTAALRTASLPGEVKGAASRVDSMGPADAIARAVGALRGATVGSPAFVSL